MMREARAATTHLREEGITADLIDRRTIYPYDGAAVLESVRKTGRLVVVHEGPRSFGVAAELISLVTEELFMDMDAAPRRVTGTDAVIPMAASEHYYFVHTEHIVDAVLDTVSL